MKKSELSFKCALPTPRCANTIVEKIKAIGVYNNDIVKTRFLESGATAMFLSIDNRMGFVFGLSDKVSFFCNWTEPLMSYEDALKLIESVELDTPDAPEFDIKPFDRILARGANGSEWLARLYESKGICSFMETGGCFCNQIIKYDGNEHLHRTANPAAGWWECENGKPVWKTK